MQASAIGSATILLFVCDIHVLDFIKSLGNWTVKLVVLYMCIEKVALEYDGNCFNSTWFVFRLDLLCGGGQTTIKEVSKFSCYTSTTTQSRLLYWN